MNRKSRERLDYHVYAKRQQIGAGVLEQQYLSGGWIRVTSEYYWLEALDDKDRMLARGLDVLLIDTTPVRPFPMRRYYSQGGVS